MITDEGVAHGVSINSVLNHFSLVAVVVVWKHRLILLLLVLMYLLGLTYRRIDHRVSLHWRQILVFFSHFIFAAMVSFNLLFVVVTRIFSLRIAVAMRSLQIHCINRFLFSWHYGRETRVRLFVTRAHVVWRLEVAHLLNWLLRYLIWALLLLHLHKDNQ
jgi:hypothetical protein